MAETADKTDRPLAQEPDERPACTMPRDEAECPLCEATMRLWAGFYRCPNCGYKESCCF